MKIPGTLPYCPFCQNSLTDCLPDDGEERLPSPGDFNICLECGMPSVFTENLALRTPKGPELLELRQEKPDLYRQIEAQAIKLGLKNGWDKL